MESEIDNLILVCLESERNRLEVGTLDGGLRHQSLVHSFHSGSCAVFHLELLLIVLVESSNAE